jgi:hypothetical protein
MSHAEDAYLAAHRPAIESALALAVNAVVAARAPDPIAFVAEQLAARHNGVWIVCCPDADAVARPADYRIFVGNFKAHDSGWPSAHMKLYQRAYRLQEGMYPVCAGSHANRSLRWNSAFNDSEFVQTAHTYADYATAYQATAAEAEIAATKGETEQEKAARVQRRFAAASYADAADSQSKLARDRAREVGDVPCNDAALRTWVDGHWGAATMIEAGASQSMLRA